MPPKRKSAAATGTKGGKGSRGSRAKGRAAEPVQSLHPLDTEINESFSLFAVSRSDMTDEEHEEAAESDPNEEDSFIRVLDARRALSALDLPKPPPDFFEPDQRLVSQDDFLQLAKAMREVKQEGDGMDVDGAEDEAAGNPKRREIDHAFALFTTPIPASGRVHVQAEEGRHRRITLGDLRRVARELREDVDENVLRIMIEEANGESGGAAVAKGVSREEFEGVMHRAGVFG